MTDMTNTCAVCGDKKTRNDQHPECVYAVRDVWVGAKVYSTKVPV